MCGNVHDFIGLEGWEMGTALSMEAAEARRAYQREYRERNRERINSQRREWRRENQDRVRRYNESYWQRVAEGKVSPRASWRDYGISKQRHQELQEVVRAGRHDALVLSAALKANEGAAGHIILSVAKGISYDYLEFHDRLGRCPLSRTNFYGARRLFFHYLDCALKGIRPINGKEEKDG